MVVVGLPVEEDTVLASFAEAEFSSPRHGPRLAQLVTPAVLARLQGATSSSWTAMERGAAIAALFAYRGLFFRPISALDPAWSETTLEIGDLPDLRTTNLLGFRDLATDLRLGTLVGALESGRHTSDGDWERNYHQLRLEYDPNIVRGRPCLIAGQETGPYTVFEGTTRLCVLIALHNEGKLPSGRVLTYLGITPRRDEWPL
jgi:hypothetical protein